MNRHRYSESVNCACSRLTRRRSTQVDLAPETNKNTHSTLTHLARPIDNILQFYYMTSNIYSISRSQLQYSYSALFRRKLIRPVFTSVAAHHSPLYSHTRSYVNEEASMAGPTNLTHRYHHCTAAVTSMRRK